MVTQLPAECPIDLNGIAERRKWPLSYARSNSIGAEFGVFRGHFAAVIARELKPQKLFLVDPWTKSGERFGWGPDPYTNYDNLTTAEALLDTRHRMAAYEQICDVTNVEDTLENFARDFEKYGIQKLDFAYLDTSHNYDDTLRQLGILAGIIADDGVILGDDSNDDVHHRHYGVLCAVNDFVKKTDFQLVLAGRDNQFCIRRAPHMTDN